jgi:hypothetical protein
MIPVYNLDPQAVKKLKTAVSAGVPDVNDLITDDMVNVFGIAGTRETVKKGLIRLRESGVRRVVLNLSGTTQEKINQIKNLKPIVEEVCS